MIIQKSFEIQIYCGKNTFWNLCLCPFCLSTKYTKSELYFFKITRAYASFLCKQSYSWASAFFDRAAAGIVGHRAGQSVIAGLNLT